MVVLYRLRAAIYTLSDIYRLQEQPAFETFSSLTMKDASGLCALAVQLGASISLTSAILRSFPAAIAFEVPRLSRNRGSGSLILGAESLEAANVQVADGSRAAVPHEVVRLPASVWARPESTRLTVLHVIARSMEAAREALLPAVFDAIGRFFRAGGRSDLPAAAGEGMSSW